MAGRREVEVLERRELSPSVCSLALRCCDGAPLDFEAGQWVDLHVQTAAGEEKRAYSIASAPGGPDPASFELGVTRVEGGVVSNVLHGLEPGARLTIDGPHGFFTREDHRDQPAVFVGTGTGLCPLRSMILDALRGEQGPPMTLLFGCRSEADILWRRELEAWADSGRVRLHVTLSRPDAAWRGRTGYVQTHLQALLQGVEPHPHVYVCGLSRMVADVRRVLKQELGYDRRSIHSERFD